MERVVESHLEKCLGERGPAVLKFHKICGTEAPTSGTPEAGSQASDRRERDGYLPFRVGASVPWAKDALKIF